MWAHLKLSSCDDANPLARQFGYAETINLDAATFNPLSKDGVNVFQHGILLRSLQTFVCICMGSGVCKRGLGLTGQSELVGFAINGIKGVVDT